MCFVFLHATASGVYFFTLHDARGAILLLSAIFSSRERAAEAMRDFRSNVGNVARYETVLACKGRHYFTFRSSSLDVVAQSRRFHSSAECEAAKQVVLNAQSVLSQPRAPSH